MKESIENLLEEIRARKVNIDTAEYRNWLFEYALCTLEYEERPRTEKEITKIITSKLKFALSKVDELYMEYNCVFSFDNCPLEDIPLIVHHEHEGKRKLQEA